MICAEANPISIFVLLAHRLVLPIIFVIAKPKAVCCWTAASVIDAVLRGDGQGLTRSPAAGLRLPCELRDKDTTLGGVARRRQKARVPSIRGDVVSSDWFMDEVPAAVVLLSGSIVSLACGRVHEQLESLSGPLVEADEHDLTVIEDLSCQL